jgi:hypothetical protein
MLQAGLQIDQAPPISVPFRFVLTAPLFVLLAALVLLWRGPEVLDSRLSPAALAVTHLITLGFMAMVMVGAMMQLLPVVAGAPISRPRTVAAITHAALLLGALSLAAGFLLAAPWLLAAGTVALAIGFAVFVAAVSMALWRSQAKGDTKRAFWFPVLGLVVTIALGVTLGSSLAWGFPLANASIRFLHPGWGLLGWAGLLAIGVAYRVVPMFQLTPRYPAPMMKYLGSVVLLLLALWSLASWVGEGVFPALAVACVVALAAANAGFAATTMLLQHRRRRRVPDATLSLWKAGMICLAAASMLWALRVLWPARVPDAVDVLIGVLALVGCAGSIVNGMLYKIVPFLAWFHLQAQPGRGRSLPSVGKMLDASHQRRQSVLHVAALGLLIAAVIVPGALVYPAALALAASAVLLEVNLLEVLRYVRDPNSSSRGSRSSDRQPVSPTGISMQRR